MISFLSEMNFMPLLTIWCNFIPENLEATSITLFTGFMNLTMNFSSYLGALLAYLLNVHNKSMENLT